MTTEQIRNFGFGVGAWTPNIATDMRRMIELNVDRIITDEPIVLGDILKEIG
jgi:glycerophosphoryl diester phosphodiesterase